ncbi:hypothetical protein J7T55_011993 [Diaporthe amygdali]|uniref:uncharacterized protein n=1 Tax=Phomopsis amygdali TaxID=1214568 RepID=UPI0022FE054C|nr:uncharacterized protein J7T55_011993 [Diaporthe amygdali]KAJ0123528.1 hypothetical protein J7T55_011993 [Diaporthe amygdali]
MTAAASMKKSWQQRKKGIMKKADEVRIKFNARVAVLIEKDGVLYAYKSHKDFPAALPGRLLECNTVTPEDYMTVRQTQRSNTGAAPSTPRSDDSLSAATGTDEPMTGFTPRPLTQPMRRSYFDSLDVEVDDCLFDLSM